MASPQTLTLGALLRRYRMAAGLTQEELAERAGLSVNAISALERGISRAPRRDTVALLAGALGLREAERGLFERAARQRETPQPVPRRDEAAPVVEGHPFVGRAAELAALDRFLAAEEPSVLLMSGEPGIGKTQLLSVATERARPAGWEVISGTCYRRGDSEPYAPFPAALLQLLGTRSPAQQRLDLHGCGWLARLLPELTEAGLLPAPTWTLPPEQERRLMIAAVGRLLANVARPAGTLLLLDDMQWAGADALALLAALLRDAPERARLRVIVGYRGSDVTPQHALAALEADLARERLATRLSLGPLARGDAAALLDALLAEDTDEAERQRVLRLTGGVPYFLVSVAQELAAEADGITTPVGVTETSSARTPGTVPWSVAASIRQRVAVLSAPAQEVVALAAIAGASTPHRVVLQAAEAMGRDEAECVAAIDEAIHAQLLAEASDEAYVCAHDLIREALLAEMAAARRGFLHRLIGEAIERLPEPERLQRSAALAWHFAQAGIPERALPYALLAGDRAAAVSAHAEAERHYRMAFDLAQTLGDERQQAVAAEGLGTAVGWQGRNAEALQQLESALAAALKRRDWTAAVRIALPLTRPYVDRSRPREGIARLAQVRQALADQATPLDLAALDLALTHLYYGTNQYGEMLVAAERALDAAPHDAPGMRAHALWRRGAALLLLARLDEALPDLEQAAELASQLGDLSQAMWSWHNAAIARLHLGDLAAAGEAAARALEIAAKLGAPDWLAAQLSLAAWVALEAGDQPGAWELATRAERVAEQIGAAWAQAMVSEARGRCALAAGDVETAGRVLEGAREHAERSGDLQRLRTAHHLLAERDLLVGEPVTALGRLTPLLDRPGATETDVNALLPTLAEAHLAAGAIAPAEALIAPTCDRLRAQHDRFMLVEALRVHALVVLRQGHRDAAEAVLAEALALGDAMGAVRARGRVEAAQRTLVHA